MPDLTQRTLGYVRDVLDEMQPEDVYTVFELTDFWKRTLFDAGFPTRFIEIAATYNFKWTDVIPDLFTGKFGPHNQAFANRVPPEIGEQFLRKLVAFAVSESEGSPIGRRLLESLKNDGFHSSTTAQAGIPAELAKLPDKESLLRDLAAQIHDGKLTSVMFIDLDNFKQVNDEHGHSEGDKCLVETVATVGGAIVGKGKLYRVGGDEFCVMLPNFSSFESAATAERVRAAVNEPYAPPIQGKDGNYYGVTTAGTAYKITASGKFTSLSHLIPYGSSAPLLQASDSKFYGVSSGTVFKLPPLGIVHSFVWAEGVNLGGGLLQTSDGNFYGTATSGGPLGSASGTVFKMTPKGVVSPIHAFDRNNKRNEGYSPYAGLLQATDGNFYGSTQYGGGSCNCGVLFKLTKTGTYSVLHTFDSVQGSVPEATLLQHTNGKMYGLSAGSGYFSSGVLYSVDLGLASFVKVMTTQGTPGQTVQILGQDFIGTTDVSFGTGSTKDFTVVLNTFMTVVVPATGTTGYVTVTTPSGTLTSSKIFKVIPVIKSFTPTNGPVGTQVTIIGSGFIGATKVTFGGVKAISYAVDSGTQITATVPTGAKTGKVAVSTPGGTASKGTFTVT